MALKLIAEDGQTGVLRYVADRYYVSGTAEDARVDSVATGFELSFVGSIPSPGQVHVALQLTLTLPDSPPPGGTNQVHVLRVVTSFDVADGVPKLIPETAEGPVIVATPRIVSDGPGAPSVLLEVDIPVGGQLVSLPAQRSLTNVSLVGTHGSDNSVRHATGHTFLTGVDAGEAVLSSAESGIGLEAGISTDGGTIIGLSIDVASDFVDEPVSTKTVRLGGLLQEVQLPVARSLSVETVAEFASGDTMVLAGVSSAPQGTEIIVLGTPRLIAMGSVPQVVVEARVVLLGGGGVSAFEGPTEQTRTQRRYSTATAEPGSGVLLQSAQQGFVVGYAGDVPVQLSLDSHTSLRFTPKTLAPGELQLDVNLTSVGFARAAPQFPLVTYKGEKLVELPQTQVLEINSHVAAHDGETLALTSGISQLSLAKSSEQLEWLLLGTTHLPADGSVVFDGRFVEVEERTSLENNARHDTANTMNEEVRCLEQPAVP